MDSDGLELWKEIEGHPGYWVSSLGRVRSPRKILKLDKRINNSGYIRTHIRTSRTRRCGHRKNEYLHRLVAIAFIPNPLKKPHVNHKNFNKLDNRVVNLEWVTSKENIVHSRDAGRYDSHSKRLAIRFRGAGSLTAKLNECQVLEIRALAGFVCRKALAKKYSVSVPSIRSIQNRETWKHI